MRFITLFIFLVFGNCILNSQSNVSLESKDIDNRIFNPSFSPKILGYLLNYSKTIDKDLIVKYTISTLGAKKQKARTAIINEDGTFELITEIGVPYQQIWLNIGDYFKGKLIVNQDLIIYADLKRLKKKEVLNFGKGIDFAGSDAGLNKYVCEYMNFESNTIEKINKEKISLLLNFTAQSKYKIQKINEIYHSLEQIEQSYIKKKGSTFKWILENERLSEYYSDILSIHWGKDIEKSLITNCVNHEPLILSNSSNQYYDFLNYFYVTPNAYEVKLLKEQVVKEQVEENAGAKNITPYEIELNKKKAKLPYDKSIVEDGDKVLAKQFEIKMAEAKLNMVLDKFSKLSPRKADLLKLVGQPIELEERAKYLKEMLPTIQTEWIRLIAQNDFDEEQNKINKISTFLKQVTKRDINTKLGDHLGYLNNGASLFTSNAEDINDFMNDVSNYYRNRAIIIDIWATWSAPSISDMKNSKPVLYGLDSLPVEVLYLCVENHSTIENWKEKISELGLHGDHVFLDKKISAQIMEYFEIGGFPSYLFFDIERNFDPYLIDGISNINIKSFKEKL